MNKTKNVVHINKNNNLIKTHESRITPLNQKK